MRRDPASLAELEGPKKGASRELFRQPQGHEYGSEEGVSGSGTGLQKQTPGQAHPDIILAGR